MRKIRFFLPVLFALVVLTVFSGTILAQKTASADSESPKPCSGEKFVMPVSITANDEGFSRYLSIALTTGKERSKIFGSLSNDQKAGIVRFQYAMQIAKRPNLTKEQSDFLLDAMSKVSPDLFDKTDPGKIRAAKTIAHDIEIRGLSLFSRRDASDIFSGIQADKQDDVVLMQRYASLLDSAGMMQRRKILHDMPMAERVNIWKTQLAFHLAASHLTAEQQKFIVDMIPNIQPILEASANLSKEDRAPYLEKVESDIFKAFSKTEAYAIFMEVGIQKKISDIPDPANLLRADCNCRWYCSEDDQSCGGSCRVVSYCGPFDTSDCTGRCTVS